MARSLNFRIYVVEGLHYVVKTYTLISCAVTTQLIFAFVFTYVKCRFSYDRAHIFCLPLAGQETTQLNPGQILVSSGPPVNIPPNQILVSSGPPGGQPTQLVTLIQSSGPGPQSSSPAPVLVQVCMSPLPQIVSSDPQGDSLLN